MPDREKVIKALEKCKCCDCDNCTEEHASHCTWDCIAYDELVSLALALLKQQEEVEPQDAEMLIIHNGGAEEYVKDIESIVLLAHKDYDIVYCGTFGRSVK